MLARLQKHVVLLISNFDLCARLGFFTCVCRFIKNSSVMVVTKQDKGKMVDIGWPDKFLTEASHL